MAEAVQTEEAIRDALKAVQFPGFSRDIVSFGMVQGVEVDGTSVHLDLNINTDDPEKQAQIEREVREAISELPGVETVEVHTSVQGAPKAAAASPAAQAGRPPGPPQAPAGLPGAPPGRPQEELWTRAPIPGVQHVIAVGSGKGGVGKSTVAINVAAALHQMGNGVGILDADVHGPDVPILLGVEGRPEPSPEGKILPLESDGLKIMSLGFFLDPREPAIWRGPIVGGLVQQFFRDVEWGELEHLLVDLPPGTGDAQLTMVQKVRLTGAVIVTTPQDLALQDAMKGLAMFQKLEVPILGVVENMSTFICPHCGKPSHIFDHGGGESAAGARGVPFLGAVPLDLAVRTSGDRGRPIVFQDPESAPGLAFRKIAERLLEELRRLPAEEPQMAPEAPGA